MSKTFEECGAAVLESIRSGASIDDAARHGGCSARTVKRWLARGRDEPSVPPFGHFAASVDAARGEQGLPSAAEEEVMGLAELKRVATIAARRGSVPAMRLIASLITDVPDPDSPDSVDRLKARRRARIMRAGGRDPYRGERPPPGGWDGLA
jgi:transposase-like protein